MKKIITIFLLSVVSWSVRAFTGEEILNLLCSIPEKYMFRFIGCVLDESPSSIEKISDLMYQCVGQYYENNGKIDSIRLLMCYDYVHEDEDVNNCFVEESKNLTIPSASEQVEFRTRIDDCMFSAK